MTIDVGVRNDGDDSFYDELTGPAGARKIWAPRELLPLERRLLQVVELHRVRVPVTRPHRHVGTLIAAVVTRDHAVNRSGLRARRTASAKTAASAVALIQYLMLPVPR